MSVPSDSLRSETVSRLRIGLLCPYSLTTPGGVQGQVMGLARALRKMGHEVRVLGPCDGAPPDTFVTPIASHYPLSPMVQLRRLPLILLQPYEQFEYYVTSNLTCCIYMNH